MSDLHTISDRDLIAHMGLLDGWEERYGYLIELGRQLPPMPDALKTEASLVRGCTSQVWLVRQPPRGGSSLNEHLLTFWADSDAHIVKGLIAVLYIVFDNQAADKVKTFDVEQYFLELGLSEHLTPNRRNGFFSMVEKLKSLSV